MLRSSLSHFHYILNILTDGKNGGTDQVSRFLSRWIQIVDEDMFVNWAEYVSC